MHRSPFLWRFHSVHHSPEHLYFLISARAHPIDNVFVRLCGMVPVYILGIGAPESVKTSLAATMVAMLITTVWGFYIHSNIRLRLGPLEWLLSTPAFHHWHHTLAEPRDRNFASMLPCWDWMFGTWHLPLQAVAAGLRRRGEAAQFGCRAVVVSAARSPAGAGSRGGRVIPSAHPHDRPRA